MSFFGGQLGVLAGNEVAALIPKEVVVSDLQTATIEAQVPARPGATLAIRQRERIPFQDEGRAERLSRYRYGPRR
jgi:hypothetical protein